MSNLLQDLNYHFRRNLKKGQDCAKIKKKLKRKSKKNKIRKNCRKPVLSESTEHRKRFKRKIKSKSLQIKKIKVKGK